MTRASGGDANNMHPVSLGGGGGIEAQTEEKILFLLNLNFQHFVCS